MQGRVKFFVLSSETSSREPMLIFFLPAYTDSSISSLVVHPNMIIDHKQEKYIVETKQI